MLQSHPFHCDRHVFRFGLVNRRRIALRYGAKTATAGADAAENKKRCRTGVKTLAQIRAGGAATYRVQIQIIDQTLYLLDAAGRYPPNQPGRAFCHLRFHQKTPYFLCSLFTIPG